MFSVMFASVYQTTNIKTCPDRKLLQINQKEKKKPIPLKLKFDFERAKNIVGKGENARSPAFPPFRIMFISYGR